MRLSRTGSCIAMAGVYLALRLTMAIVRHWSIDPRLAIFLSISVLMLAQLAFVVSVAGLQMRLKLAILIAVCGAGTVLGIFLVMKSVKLAPLIESLLSGGSDFILMLSAATLGSAISIIIREPNILLPASVFAALVDLWSVTIGPLSRVIEKKPGLLEAVAVKMPVSVPGVPGTMIGLGDFVFLALFFSVLFRFKLNVKGAFWWGYALLTASMLFVQRYGSAIPALVPISVAVLGANRKNFKLKREELLATVYIGAFLLLILVAMGWIKGFYTL